MTVTRRGRAVNPGSHGRALQSPGRCRAAQENSLGLQPQDCPRIPDSALKGRGEENDMALLRRVPRPSRGLGVRGLPRPEGLVRGTQTFGDRSIRDCRRPPEHGVPAPLQGASTSFTAFLGLKPQAICPRPFGALTTHGAKAASCARGGRPAVLSPGERRSCLTRAPGRLNTYEAPGPSRAVCGARRSVRSIASRPRGPPAPSRRSAAGPPSSAALAGRGAGTPGKGARRPGCTRSSGRRFVPGGADLGQVHGDILRRAVDRAIDHERIVGGRRPRCRTARSGNGVGLMAGPKALDLQSRRRSQR